MRRKFQPATNTIVLRGLPYGGYRPDYRATLSQHVTVENAVRWGRISGLAAWPGGDRLGRIWIEDKNHPATKEVAA